MEYFVYQSGIVVILTLTTFWLLGVKDDNIGKKFWGIFCNVLIAFPREFSIFYPIPWYLKDIAYILSIYGQTVVYCRLCQGTWVKKIFGAALAEIIISPGLLVAHCLCVSLNFQKEFMAVPTDITEIIGIILFLMGYFLLLTQVFKNQGEFFRDLNIGHTRLEKCFILLHLSWLVFSDMPRLGFRNSPLNDYFDTLEYVSFYIMCTFVVLFYLEIQKEKKENIYLSIQQSLLNSHYKILEEQILFSSQLREEISRQVEEFMEGQTLNTKECRDKLLDLVGKLRRTEYCDNIVLNAFLEQKISGLEKKGVEVWFENQNFSAKTFQTVEWIELFKILWNTMERGYENTGKVKLILSNKLEREIISLSYSGKIKKQEVKRWKRQSRKILNKKGGLEWKVEEGRTCLNVIL